MNRRTARMLALAAVAAALLALPAAAAPRHAKPKPKPKPAARVETPVATPAVAAVDSSQLAWREARTLADDRRYAEALAVIDRRLAADPGDVDLLWLRAGVTGWAGHHAEAVRQYEHLVARHPDKIGDVRMDLATERLWAGDPNGAVRDLDERLADVPGDRAAQVLRALALSHADRLAESLAAYDTLIARSPDDLSLLNERARVLAWMGRSRESQAAYRAVLARDPHNAGAELGLARAENDAGRHRHALARLAPLAAQPDADTDVLRTMAWAHYWSGNAPAAQLSVEALLAHAPDDADAMALRHRIDRELSPGLTLGYGRADDSDALRVGSTTMELAWPVLARNVITAGWQRSNVRDAFGTRDPLRVGGGLRTWWNPEWTTTASTYWVDMGDGGGTNGTGELGITWRPEDRLRFDVGVSRDLVETRRSLDLGISSQTWVGGIDWRVTPHATLHADVRNRFFSDGNHAQMETFAGEARAYADKRLRIVARARVQQLRTRRDLDHGYYDPAQYLEWGPGVSAEWEPWRSVTASGTLWGGWQREKNAESTPYANGAVRVEWTIERFATFAIEGGRSNSNLESQTGYQQNRWAASITRGFGR